MNPLSGIGMPDWFWEKYQASCAQPDGSQYQYKCGCGSGLMVTDLTIPVLTETGLMWFCYSGYHYRCLVCATCGNWVRYAEIKKKVEDDNGMSNM